MSKLMTLEMLFEAIKEGRVSLDTPFSVSQRAYQMGGSRMFLEMTRPAHGGRTDPRHRHPVGQ